MGNGLYQFIVEKNLAAIREILSADAGLANDGITLHDQPHAKKGHPLHRLCDAVFGKKITDEDAIEMAKIFLAFGANINGYQSLGDNNTPLIAAASLHAEQLGIFYIGQGADIFYASPGDGATALHWAAYCGRDQLVQALIEKGAKTDQRDIAYGGTPLDWAIHSLRSGDSNNLFNQSGCIKLMMNAGAALKGADAEYIKSMHFFE
ncbi:MAG TPA: ankyrin repeat domain-containing protein [Puia sp.]|nr:ankyrin repeat domain-containing protein [Puia sp.]